MINIISKSILSKKVRGPKKVVDNLVKGLEKINYPYVVNARLDACQKLWIHDDINALKKINSLPNNIETLVGPNLFVNPENIPTNINLSKTIYIHPSENVKRVWQKRGYDISPIEVWPVGVDTDEFKHVEIPKKHVLIYFKNREERELTEVEDILKNKKIDYQIIRYGKYKEKEYRETLSKSKYIIWLGCSESQGLALEEALSMNIPALVIDSGNIEYGVELTSAPYFDERCGIKIKNFNDIDKNIVSMESKYQDLKPREYILENLSLEKQAQDFIKLYEKHFGLNFASGITEKTTPKGSWRNSKLYYRFWYRIKECLKDFVVFFGKD